MEVECGRKNEDQKLRGLEKVMERAILTLTIRDESEMNK